MDHPCWNLTWRSFSESVLRWMLSAFGDSLGPRPSTTTKPQSHFKILSKNPFGLSKKKPLDIQTCFFWCRETEVLRLWHPWWFMTPADLQNRFQLQRCTDSSGGFRRWKKRSNSLNLWQGQARKSFTVIANYKGLGVVNWNSNMFNIISPCIRPLDTPCLTTRKRCLFVGRNIEWLRDSSDKG